MIASERSRTKNFCRSSIKPPEGLILFWTLQRGLFRERGRGGLFTKSNNKDMYDNFSVLLTPYFVDSTYNLMGQIHKFDTTVFDTFSMQNNTKTNVQACLCPRNRTLSKRK